MMAESGRSLMELIAGHQNFDTRLRSTIVDGAGTGVNIPVTGFDLNDKLLLVREVVGGGGGGGGSYQRVLRSEIFVSDGVTAAYTFGLAHQNCPGDITFDHANDDLIHVLFHDPASPTWGQRVPYAPASHVSGTALNTVTFAPGFIPPVNSTCVAYWEKETVTTGGSGTGTPADNNYTSIAQKDSDNPGTIRINADTTGKKIEVIFIDMAD